MSHTRMSRLFVSLFTAGILCICGSEAGTISFDTFTRVTISGAQSDAGILPAGVTGLGYLGNGNFVVSLLGAGPISTLVFTSNGASQHPFGPSTVSFTGVDQYGRLEGEHPLAVSPGLGGFTNNDVYVSDASTIYHLNGQGAVVGTLSVPSLASGGSQTIRAMMFDSTGTFGNNMLVSTEKGNIYTINSAGQVNLLATVPAAMQPGDPQRAHDVEAMAIAPLGVFGPFAGQLILALHDGGTSQQNAPKGLYAVAPNGVITQLPILGSLGVFEAESLVFVPALAGSSSFNGFYASLYPFQVMKTGLSGFNGLAGDALIFSEGPPGAPGLYRLHWNGSSFDALSPLDLKLPSAVADDACAGCGELVNMPEQALFVSDPIPEPATFGLCGVVLLAGFFLRRTLAKAG